MPVVSLQDEQTFPRYKRVPFNSDSLPQDAFLLAAFWRVSAHAYIEVLKSIQILPEVNQGEG